MGSLLLLFGELAQNDLLSDEVDFLVFRGVSESYQEGSSKVTPSNALEFFKLLLV
jgi:hypothetical protein